MIRRICLSFAVLAAVMIATPASATLLYSFEADDPLVPLSLGATQNGGGVAVDSGSGITEGSQALRLSNASGSYDKLGHFILNDLADPGTAISEFEVDWYYESVSINGNPNYNGLAIGLFLQGPNVFDQLTGAGEFIGWDAGATGSYTIKYVLDGTETGLVNNALANGIPLEVGFYANKHPEFVGNYTVDNVRFDGVRLVPEPATALIGGIALALTALSRRRA